MIFSAVGGAFHCPIPHLNPRQYVRLHTQRSLREPKWRTPRALSEHSLPLTSLYQSMSAATRAPQQNLPVSDQNRPLTVTPPHAAGCYSANISVSTRTERAQPPSNIPVRESLPRYANISSIFIHFSGKNGDFCTYNASKNHENFHADA